MFFETKFSLRLISNRKFSMKSDNPKKHPIFNSDHINPLVFDVEYACRGPILIKANELQKEIEKGFSKSFKKLVKCNLGNCHLLGQKPVTFYRQVLAGCAYPELLAKNLFPTDVIHRATALLKSFNGSIGCYTESTGTEYIRNRVASFIEKRDGYPCNPDHIVLTNGASPGIKSLIYILTRNYDDKITGFMVPVPQYPLYSATISEMNGRLIPYYLCEEKGWSLEPEELKNSIENGLKFSKPKVLVVINPGNPTGQILTYQNMVDIVKFCHQHQLILFADEVYQENIYEKEFFSFKKVVKDLGFNEHDFSLVSFHSISKGFYGECGLRGGYMELFGLSSNVFKQLFKLLSAQLCSSTVGQLVMECVTNPPSPGDPSYTLFSAEKFQILEELKKKAEMTYSELNKVKGITCNKIQGALYAFPQLHLPEKFILKAEQSKMTPDEYYCFQLLEETGVVVVPGSGFKQQKNTFHFRLTIIPPYDDMKDVINSIKKFNESIFENYN